jgi:hypothetical protein
VLTMGYPGIKTLKNERKLPARPGKWRCAQANVSYWISIRHGTPLLDKVEQMKASLLAEVEGIIRVVKCQFVFTKVRYRGYKNATQIIMQSLRPFSGRQDERCRKGRRR